MVTKLVRTEMCLQVDALIDQWQGDNVPLDDIIDVLLEMTEICIDLEENDK